MTGPTADREWVKWAPAQWLGLALVSALWIGLLLSEPARGGEPAPDLPTLIAAALPGVVNIRTLRLEPVPHAIPGAPPVRQVLNYGSGFVIDPSGLIVTNRHLVEGAAVVTVAFQDGMRLPAALVSAGQRLDVALLRVATTEKLTVLRFGRSDKLRTGDTVVAIGNRWGLALPRAQAL